MFTSYTNIFFRVQLTEALLTLANLTVDENTREELYARAQAEGVDALWLDPLGIVELDSHVERELPPSTGSAPNDGKDECSNVGATHAVVGRCGAGCGLLVLDEVHPHATRSSSRCLTGLKRDIEAAEGLGLNVGNEKGTDWMDET
jgi:hypothetical protein